MDYNTSENCSEAVKAALVRLDTARRACPPMIRRPRHWSTNGRRAAYADALQSNGRTTPEDDPLGTGTE